MPGTAEPGDTFGRHLAAGEGESVNATSDGAFTTLPGGVFFQGSQLPGGAADDGQLGWSFG